MYYITWKMLHRCQFTDQQKTDTVCGFLYFILDKEGVENGTETREEAEEAAANFGCDQDKTCEFIKQQLEGGGGDGHGGGPPPPPGPPDPEDFPSSCTRIIEQLQRGDGDDGDGQGGDGGSGGNGGQSGSGSSSPAANSGGPSAPSSGAGTSSGSSSAGAQSAASDAVSSALDTLGRKRKRRAAPPFSGPNLGPGPPVIERPDPVKPKPTTDAYNEAKFVMRYLGLDAPTR